MKVISEKIVEYKYLKVSFNDSKYLRTSTTVKGTDEEKEVTWHSLDNLSSGTPKRLSVTESKEIERDYKINLLL